MHRVTHFTPPLSRGGRGCVHKRDGLYTQGKYNRIFHIFSISLDFLPAEAKAHDWQAGCLLEFILSLSKDKDKSIMKKERKLHFLIPNIKHQTRLRNFSNSFNLWLRVKKITNTNCLLYIARYLIFKLLNIKTPNNFSLSRNLTISSARFVPSQTLSICAFVL